MDKIRKFGAWLWLNKERMLLGVLVVFLCYRVYVIMGDTNIKTVDTIINPQASGAVDTPQVPPVAPTVKPGSAYTSLSAKSPFLWRKGAARDDDGKAILDISLRDILTIRGELQAYIRLPGRRPRRCSVGDTVGQWTVLTIREDSVEVEHTDTGEKGELRLLEK